MKKLRSLCALCKKETQPGFRARLLCSSLVLCIGFLLCEYGSTVHIFKNLLLERYNDQNTTTFSQVEGYLDSFMEICETDFQLLDGNAELADALTAPCEADNYNELLERRETLEALVGSVFQQQRYVGQYILVGTNGFVFEGSPQASARYSGQVDFNTVYTFLEREGLFQSYGFRLASWPGSEADSAFADTDLFDTLAQEMILCRELTDADGSTAGVLVLTLNDALWSDIFSEDLWGTGSLPNAICVSNAAGNLLWSVGTSQEGFASSTAAFSTSAENPSCTTVHMDGAATLVTCYRIEAYDLTFVTYYPVSNLLDAYFHANAWVVVAFFLILLWVIPFSIRFSAKVTAPLHTLADKLQHDLENFTKADFLEILLPGQSMFSKLLLFFLAAVLLPNTIFIGTLTWSSYGVYRDAVEQDTTASVWQSKWNLDQILANYRQVSLSLSYDPDISQMIKAQDFTQLEETFEKIRLTQPDFLAMAVVSCTGEQMFLSDYYDIDVLIEAASLIPAEMEDAGENLTYIGLQDTHPNGQVMVFSQKLYSLDSAKLVGYTVYLVSEDSFSTVLETLSADGTVFGSILDQQGDLVAGSTAYVSEESCLTFSAGTEIAGLSVAGAISLQELSRTVFYQMRVLFVLLVLFVLIILTLSAFLSYRLTHPLKELQEKLLRLSYGDFSVNMEYNGKDEIGILALYFNEMVCRLKTLIEENYQSKIRENELKYLEKEAQLNALQQQINPHFLYNTLDSIRWMAYTAGAKDAGNMAAALGRFFKGSIIKENTPVTVREEVEHLDNYLYIQKIRYADRFSVNQEIDEAALDRPIMKLVLQPLVENALIHGLSGIQQGGMIVLRIRLDETYLYFEVRDNGVGMSQEQLEALRHHLSSDEETAPGKSVGLVNVYKRLYLHYGDEVHFVIDSVPGCGTAISFRIPQKEV